MFPPILEATPEVLANELTFAPTSLFLLFIFFGMLFPLATQFISFFSKKVFYIKFAQQASKLLWGINWLLLVLLVAVWGWAEFFKQDEPFTMLTPGYYTTCASMILLIFLLSAAYMFLWKKWKEIKLLHFLLGISAYLVFITGISSNGMFALLSAMQAPPIADPVLEVQQHGLPILKVISVFLYSSSTMYALALWLSCLTIATSASLCMLWSIIRRNTDDFGRDYYTFAMHYTAAVALFFLVTCVASFGVFYYPVLTELLSRPSFTLEHYYTFYGVLAGLFLLACLILTVIIKSPTPMRHKVGAVCISFLLVLIFTLQIIVTVLPFRYFPQPA